MGGGIWKGGNHLPCGACYARLGSLPARAVCAQPSACTHKRQAERQPTPLPPRAGSGPARDVNNGMGPLRIWPGGLCLSRAVGDFDVGESVIPLPHIYQVP